MSTTYFGNPKSNLKIFKNGSGYYSSVSIVVVRHKVSWTVSEKVLTGTSIPLKFDID